MIPHMKVMLAATAALIGSARAAPLENNYLLQTKNTTMAFQKKGDLWLMIHYGAKVEQGKDVAALAWSGGYSQSTFGPRQPTTYSIYGSDNDARSMNKYGGLAVIHADGVTSTELATTNAS